MGKRELNLFVYFKKYIFIFIFFQIATNNLNYSRDIKFCSEQLGQVQEKYGATHINSPPPTSSDKQWKLYCFIIILLISCQIVYVADMRIKTTQNIEVFYSLVLKIQLQLWWVCVSQRSRLLLRAVDEADLLFIFYVQFLVNICSSLRLP